jgi:deazaflavin-dependent oxidoreductase (nitroreductase family)
VVPEVNDFNTKIIEEFRQNQGKVGPPFEGATLLLLHSQGAKTGTERINPMVYQVVNDEYAVFASKAGAPTNPDWYHNLLAHPKAKVEIGPDVIEVEARVASGQERTKIWEKQKAIAPGFAEYETKTDREIPVVLLRPT